MLELFIHGHARSCPVPAHSCTCEWKLYAVTGILAFLAASIEWHIGYHHGVVTLGDAAHAVADGLSDSIGILVSLSAVTFMTRTRGDHFIAIFLAISVVGIFLITAQKFVYGYDLDPRLIMLAGGVGAGINILRAYMFYRGYQTDKNSTRVGLMIHALTDAVHSSVVFAAGALGTIIGLFGLSYHHLVYGDVLLSIALCVYIASMVPGVWRGDHHHKVFDLTLGRLRFFKKLEKEAGHDHDHHH